MGGTTRLFVGGLPVSKELSEGELMKVVGKYAKAVEIIRDSEGYCKGFAYINVPQPSAATCVSSLHNSTFQKGILRVEYAQESFMERLQREWGHAPVTMNFKLDTSAKVGSATPSKLSNGNTTKTTPTNTPKPTNGAETTSTNTPKEANGAEKKLDKKDKKAALRAKIREKEAQRKLAVAEKKANNKRKADEIETNGKETKEAETEVEETKEEETKEEEKIEKTEKKEEANENTNSKPKLTKRQRKNQQNAATKTPPPSSSSLPATLPASLPLPSTPATPASSSSYPITPSTAPPTSNNSETSLWDATQVHAWANNIAGNELADKLKAKGVKGRKLVNWKDTFGSNPNGLRKQITEFLQLPENLEADADDLSSAILQLK